MATGQQFTFKQNGCPLPNYAYGPNFRLIAMVLQGILDCLLDYKRTPAPMSTVVL
uniref:Uncharacterized protein n=1 Tax=Anguilla anguilla TaxID=7936 RepID=A0A0E9XH51_ANGAN